MSINDGLALIRRHDFEGALPLLAAEVRKRPDDAYAAYYLAYAFVGAQDPQPAVMLLRDAKRLRRPALPEVADAEIADRLLRYEAALQPIRRARGGLPDMPGWVLCVLGVTLALTLMASAGVPGAWNGMRHYQDGKARLVTLDYAGCAAEMEQAVESVPNSPKVWAYEAYCFLLDKDTKAGLSAWYTARSYDPAITLDTPSDQLALLAKVKAANAAPKVTAK